MSIAIRRWVIAFVAVQLVGLTCQWLWPYSLLAGRVLWNTAFIALFPGNMLSAMLVEPLLWRSDWSLTAMSLAEVPVLVALNAVVWFGVIGIFRKLIRSGRWPARSRQQSGYRK